MGRRLTVKVIISLKIAVRIYNSWMSTDLGRNCPFIPRVGIKNGSNVVNHDWVNHHAITILFISSF